MENLSRSDFHGSRRRELLNQFGHAIRHLCAHAHPILDAVVNEIHCRRVGAGVVGPHNFNRTPVASAILLNDNNTVIRLLGGANARQTNHDHGDTFPFNPDKIRMGLGSCAFRSVSKRIRAETARAQNATTKYRRKLPFSATARTVRRQSQVLKFHHSDPGFRSEYCQPPMTSEESVGKTACTGVSTSVSGCAPGRTTTISNTRTRLSETSTGREMPAIRPRNPASQSGLAIRPRDQANSSSLDTHSAECARWLPWLSILAQLPIIGCSPASADRARPGSFRDSPASTLTHPQRSANRGESTSPT